MLWRFYDFHLLRSYKLCRKGICNLCWKLSGFPFLWAIWFPAEPVNFYCWAISPYFLLPWKICGLHCSWLPWIGSDLFPPDLKYQQCSGISYVQVPLNSAVILLFLWIKCCCYGIPGSPEYKGINYMSTQQHLSLKLGIIYLASA